MYAEYNRKYQILYTELREAYDRYLGDAGVLVTINRVKARMLKLQREFDTLSFGSMKHECRGKSFRHFKWVNVDGRERL